MLFTEKPSDFRSDIEVVGCFCESNDQFLLLLRHEDKEEPNLWGVPAGKVHTGEDLTAAMVREIQEETGIATTASQLEFFQTVFVRFAAIDIVYHMFRLSLEGQPEVILSPTEHTQKKWVTPKEALQLPLVQDEDVCIKMFYQL